MGAGQWVNALTTICGVVVFAFSVYIGFWRIQPCFKAKPECVMNDVELTQRGAQNAIQPPL